MDIENQYVELLPARTVLTTLAWGGHDHGESSDDDNSESGNGLIGINALNPSA